MNNTSRHIARLEDNYRAAYLISGFIQKDLTQEEAEELDNWILADEDNMKVFEDLTDERQRDEYLQWYSERDTEMALKKVKERILFNKPSPRVLFLRYAAAACIAGLLCFGIYWFKFHRIESHPEKMITKKQDIQPGSKMARLDMSNGKVIYLDDIKDSIINEQVQIKDGMIIYTKNNPEPVMQELSIPRKGYYQLVLPDGSKVWVNAESSIRYPSAFTGNERNVSLIGEAYFEVAKDPSKPFIVSVNGIRVQALGTRFNINAYSNERYLRATLVEGSIKVSSDKNQVVLSPNEQLNIAGSQWAVKMIDASPFTAWVDNKFKLKSTPIEEVMRMLERWYDAKIIYEDSIDFHFNGTIDRSAPVSQLLALLEETGHVHFSIEGNTIRVKK